MRGRIATRSGALALAVALIAAACGGDDGGGTSNNQGNQGGTGRTEAPKTSSAKGGELKILSTDDFDYLDPARTYYAFGFNFQRLLTRSLTNYKSVPGPEGTELVGDLAEAPATSTDGRTWTYKLRAGLKFQDGTPVTSKDVKYGIERVFATDVINGGPTYFIDYLQTTPEYQGPYKDTSPDKLGLKSIETPDDSTITFKLNKAFGDWNSVMALPGASPVQQKIDQARATGGDRYNFNVQATGPYKIAKYEPNKSLRLVRNDQWSQDTDPFRKALPDTITVTIGNSSDDIDQRIISNQADYDLSGTGVQVATQARVLREPALKARSNNPVTGFVRYLTIQTKVPPFDNIECRKAVAYAFNKNSNQRARGGPTGAGQIATTFLPPTIPGYVKFDVYPSGPDNTGDVAKAKEALTKCGQPNGFSTKLAFQNRGRGPQEAAAIQEALSRVGIRVQVQPAAAATYYSQYIGSPANVKRNGLGLALAAWGADWPGPFTMFYLLFDGNQISDPGNHNYAELNDPEINKMIQDAAQNPDRDAALKQWGEVDRAVVESAAVVPYLHDKALVLHSERLKNAFTHQAFGQYDIQALGVA
jgi:peptide/nickel transport system substrate-binding protein